MEKITKKEIASQVKMSCDAFGKNFEIDTTSDFDAKFSLIAARSSLSSVININFNGEKKTAHMNSSSKNEFVNSIYEVLEQKIK